MMITTELPFFSTEYIERSMLGWIVTVIGHRLIKLPHQDASWAILSFYAQREVALLKIIIQVINDCIQI